MKWLVALVGMFALPAVAKEHTLDNLELEIQQQSSLCWAAVSAMASSASKVPCQYRRPTQLDVVYSEQMCTPERCSHELPLRCPPRGNCTAGLAVQCTVDADDNWLPNPDPLEEGRLKCGPDGLPCNISRSTYLLDLVSRKISQLGNSNVNELAAERIGHEIGVRKQPVIIAWSYLDPATLSEAELLQRLGGNEGLALLNSSRKNTRHFLIITGYNDETQEVRVWDPWPDQSVLVEPPGHIRHKWIPYERYQNPRVDNGAPVNADHDSDEFAFCRGCSLTKITQILATPPPLQHIQAQRIVSPRIFDFSHDVPALRDERDNVTRVRIVRKENGSRVRGRLTTDTGFATVLITTKRLLNERPEALLEAKTTSLVVPVLRGNKLVDSFLLINSGHDWQEGGYSNNEIARRLMQYRTERGSEGRYYLVAIPEQGKFYVAHGFGADAKLVPLDGNVRAEFVPAAGVISRLADDVRRIQAHEPERPQG